MGATTMSEAELCALQEINDVVRMGRILCLGDCT